MANRHHGQESFGAGLKVHISEIESVTRLSFPHLAGQFEMLTNYGFISGIETGEFTVPVTTLLDLKIGWPICEDLLKFCEKTHTTLEKIIVELHFDCLD